MSQFFHRLKRRLNLTRFIYRKCLCILDDVQMDQLGMCDACEIAAIPEEVLAEYKEKRLKAIDEAAAML